MIKLIREHLSTKIFIITVCLLITVGSAIYGMVALGMSRNYFLELDRSLSNQTEKMVLQLSNTSVQEIDGILKMFALEHGISIVLKDSDEKVLGIYGDMEYSLAPGTDVEDILLGSGITESYSCKLTNGKTYWIQVFGNKEKVNIGLESLKRILPMLGAITFLAALAIAALYTKYITRSADDSEVLANADLRGAVLEFSDTGCNISIGTQTDDAEMVPAPGAVVEEMNQVKIVYGENTYFQISHSTMTGITLEDCPKEEVKKQSMLYLYGDYQEDGTFLAKRVIIDRFEKEGEWE